MRKTVFGLLFILPLLLSGCWEYDEEKVTLENSTWEGTMSGITRRVTFKGKKDCTYEEVAEDGQTTTVKYTYSFQRPNVYFTPVESTNYKLKGEVLYTEMALVKLIENDTPVSLGNLVQK
ncbi:hypothetical protein [Bacteroides sp. 519]|uniref:hypothetical protein n=1 Tax=Bacteroides sp. 519 TaxID=2302937 RepID=UPI0013D196C3|nr:hypothetical protein [Bacteroides sp. 519]NDV56906.1 hypothetical protein [Bacteroides sp. 519]